MPEPTMPEIAEPETAGSDRSVSPPDIPLHTLLDLQVLPEVEGSTVSEVLMPVAPQPPRLIGHDATVLEGYLGDIFTLPANLTSFPALAFPMGVFDKLPAGVQALAAPFREDYLYRVASIV